MTTSLNTLVPAEPAEEFNEVLATTERSVLAAVMYDPTQMDALMGELEVPHFRDPINQVIYSRMIEMHGRGVRVEALAVMQSIADDASLAPHQRRIVLEHLPRMITHSLNGSRVFKNDIEFIRNAAARRLAGEMSIRLHQVAKDATPEELEDALDRMREVFSGAVRPSSGPSRRGMGDAVNDLVARADNPVKQVVVPSPYRDLNDLLCGGYYPGQMIVVGARPAVGKSVSGLDTARTAVKHGYRTLFVSLEMPEEEITARFLAATAAVNLTKTRQISRDPEVLTDDEWLRIVNVQGETDLLNDLLVLVDPRGMQEDSRGAAKFTPATLRRHLMAMKRLGTPVDVAVLDYLQLLKSVDKAENRQNEVSDISRNLKLLAVEFNIPIVMMAQLNRNPEGRADKRPQVSDLRESGAIENDADVVMLLHREDLHSSDPAGPKSGEMEIIVGKNRNGPTGVTSVAFQGHYSRAVDMARGLP